LIKERILFKKKPQIHLFEFEAFFNFYKMIGKDNLRVIKAIKSKR